MKGYIGGGESLFGAVGMHLNLLLCLSKQKSLLSLSGVFLLLGKTKCGLSGLN